MPNRTLKKIVGFYKIIHMKNIKKTILAVLVLFVGTTLFISCSNDSEIETKNPSSSVLDTFLKSFYNQDYVLGNTISISNGAKSSAMSRTILVDGQNVEITEVILANNQRVRGYVLTDKITNAFLYFVDIDRITYDLTIVDVINNETLVFKNINTNRDYHNTNEFDLYRMAENYNQAIQNNVQGRFWGTAFEQGPCDGPAGVGQAYVYKNYYVLGIRVSHVLQVSVDGSGEPLKEPCGSR
jgi:endonuclease V-like protein UPF0215 family